MEIILGPINLYFKLASSTNEKKNPAFLTKRNTQPQLQNYTQCLHFIKAHFGHLCHCPTGILI